MRSDEADFLDVVSNDSHPSHPRVGFEFPEDEPEEVSPVNTAVDEVRAWMRWILRDGHATWSEAISRFAVSAAVLDPELASVCRPFRRRGVPAFVSPRRADVCEGMRRLAHWIVGDSVLKHILKGGIQIRLAVAVWMINPEFFNNATERELAHILGRRHKQSVNREVTSFRRTFGYFHRLMRPDEAVANMRTSFHQREDGER